MTAKELLRRETESAYNGDEMSLLCGVYARKWVPPDNLVRDPDRDLTPEQARQQPAVWHCPILSILEHVADCKAMYMEQAFGPPPEPYPEPGGSLVTMLAYLESTHRRLLACLDALDDHALARPVPTACHGETAADLFWVLAQHDVCHGAQITVIRGTLAG